VGESEFALFEWPVPPGQAAEAALSPAERTVVELALAGCSNGEIAIRRGCSRRTVANELASAYAKVGVGSRAELAVWALGREPA
jgi:DNA-binding CsgD family transcriptional regulator